VFEIAKTSFPCVIEIVKVAFSAGSVIYLKEENFISDNFDKDENIFGLLKNFDLIKVNETDNTTGDLNNVEEWNV
jgi:hypothetical protein